MFRLSLETENAAFDPNPYGEVARILRSVADRLDDGRSDGDLRDINGNRCGTWTLDFPNPGGPDAAERS